MPQEIVSSDTTDSKTNVIDLADAKETTPNEAPVSDPSPLTGKEKAGVYLTWGIIFVMLGLTVFILSIFIWGESKFFEAIVELNKLKAAATKPNELKELNTILADSNSHRTAFRTFWFDTLQLILLNILFPTLTALLGYVFGTSRNGSSKE